jgi:acyl-CoA thioesterase FadM
MSFTTHRTILFGDCDPAGIVYTPRIAVRIEAVAASWSPRPICRNAKVLA